MSLFSASLCIGVSWRPKFCTMRYEIWSGSAWARRVKGVIRIVSDSRRGMAASEEISRGSRCISINAPTSDCGWACIV